MQHHRGMVAEARSPAGGQLSEDPAASPHTDPLRRALHPPRARAGFPAADPVPVGCLLLLRGQDRAHHAGGEPPTPSPPPQLPGSLPGCWEHHSGLWQIIKDRLSPHRSRSRFLWNALPGGLLVLPDFSTHLGDFPFYYLQHGRILPAPAERGKLGACHNTCPFPPSFQATAPPRSSRLSSGRSRRQGPCPSPSSGSSKPSPDPSTVPRWEELSPASLGAAPRDAAG